MRRGLIKVGGASWTTSCVLNPFPVMATTVNSSGAIRPCAISLRVAARCRPRVDGSEKLEPLTRGYPIPLLRSDLGFIRKWNRQGDRTEMAGIDGWGGWFLDQALPCFFPIFKEFLFPGLFPLFHQCLKNGAQLHRREGSDDHAVVHNRRGR